MTAKREAANKQALEVFCDAEKEAKQKYQAKLRQHDKREDRNRTQEEAVISRATEAIEKATLQREKAEAAIVKATAQLTAATEALSALDTTRDDKNETARRARDKANAKALALRDATLAATETVFQDKLEKATNTRDETMQSDAVRDLQAQVCALDGEMAKELSFEVNRKNFQRDSDDSDSSDDDQPVRSLLTKAVRGSPNRMEVNLLKCRRLARWESHLTLRMQTQQEGRRPVSLMVCTSNLGWMLPPAWCLRVEVSRASSIRGNLKHAQWIVGLPLKVLTHRE